MKLLIVFAFYISIIHCARIIQFINYSDEWVKGKDYNLQWTYLEEPAFSEFDIRLYNSTYSETIESISTNDYISKEIHEKNITMPSVSTGRYRMVGISANQEICDYISFKVVLKASTTTITKTQTETIQTPTSSTNNNGNETNVVEEDNNKTWKIIAIILSIIFVLFIIAMILFLLYNRHKKSKQMEKEANSSIWKVPIPSADTSRVMSRGAGAGSTINHYSVPNASITERDLSFTSDLDGFYSYSSQKNQDYFSPHLNYATGGREKTEHPKSIYSYSTNITKVSNNILDILYPSNEKNETMIQASSSKKNTINDQEHARSLQRSGVSSSNGQQQHRKSHSRSRSRHVRSKTSEKQLNNHVNTRSNSVKSGAIINKKSRLSLLENDMGVNHHTNTNTPTTITNLNNNSSIPISTLSSIPHNELDEQDIEEATYTDPTTTTLTGDQQTAQDYNSPNFYLKNIKLNKKYQAACHFKPRLDDELSISKNDILIIYEFYKDGWGYGKNITTEKDGLFPLNCIDI